ncbi:hypothetical protein [Prochlorothrix hollandica]|uniref:hypothetical protein n=1 Tax=Prochlorothrix hollandica TaxID=1223 RepID=UPI00034A9AD1|nr:hypothetical protein [Prochlorothrix hollandica]
MNNRLSAVVDRSQPRSSAPVPKSSQKPGQQRDTTPSTDTSSESDWFNQTLAALF